MSTAKPRYNAIDVTSFESTVILMSDIRLMVAKAPLLQDGMYSTLIDKEVVCTEIFLKIHTLIVI